jgi:hypothetical protein
MNRTLVVVALIVSASRVSGQKPDVAVTDWSGRNALAGVREMHPRGLRVVNLADGTNRGAGALRIWGQDNVSPHHTQAGQR